MHEETPEEETTPVILSVALRDLVNEMAEKLFVHGNRCHHRGGRESKPHQRALLEAAWEVAQRYPEEFGMAVMKRTEPRHEFGVTAAHRAQGHRPR